MDFPCPLCGQSSQRRFQRHHYWIRDCDGCGHRFTELQPTSAHVANIYADSYFYGGEAGYLDYLAEAKLLRRQGQRYAALLKHYTPPGRMLDVGAAAGFILQGFQDAGWQGQGIEPNPMMVRYGQEKLGLPLTVGTLEQLQSTILFDLITMIQVVAHFFDVRRAFTIASQHTKIGGFWLIETWNCESWMARLLGAQWHEYSPPSVLHWFSPDRLALLATQYGFREVARGRPPKFISGVHAKSLLRYKLQTMPAGKVLLRVLSLLPDHWLFPYPAEDLFWMILQKQ